MNHVEAVDALREAFNGEIVRFGPYYTEKRKLREMENLTDATRFDPVVDLPRVDIEGTVERIDLPEPGRAAEITAWINVRQPKGREVYVLHVNRYDARTLAELRLAKELGKRVVASGYQWIERYTDERGVRRMAAHVEAQFCHVSE